MKKLGILVSGQGSNMTAILNACEQGYLQAEVEVVITQIDRRTRKISLSMKAKEFVEEKAAMENYKKLSPESNGSTLGDLLKEAKDK